MIPRALVFIFLPFLLGIFCCGPLTFSLKHCCQAVHRKQIANKIATTYVKYIIAPALYLQTQIIMGAAKKNPQIRSFLDSGSVVLIRRFVAATKCLASSTSKCATPTGTQQARYVVVGVTAHSRNREKPFCNRTMVYRSYAFLSMNACRARDKEGIVARWWDRRAASFAPGAGRKGAQRDC